MSKIGHFLFRYRNAMFPLVALPLLLPGPEPFEETLTATLLGVIVAGLGQWIRVLTIGLRYVVRGGRGGRVYADDLVTDGVYSHVRNPMYVGNVLIVIGVALASNSWATIVVGTALAVFMYSCIVAAEEEYLRSRFGSAFEAYCRDVPRWLPRLRSMQPTLAKMRFHWRRVVVKEYGTPFGWITVLAAVTLVEFWHDGEWGRRQAEINVVTAVVVIATLLWFVAWRLKRTKTLVAD